MKKKALFTILILSMLFLTGCLNPEKLTRKSITEPFTLTSFQNTLSNIWKFLGADAGFKAVFAILIFSIIFLGLSLIRRRGRAVLESHQGVKIGVSLAIAIGIAAVMPAQTLKEIIGSTILFVINGALGLALLLLIPIIKESLWDEETSFSWKWILTGFFLILFAMLVLSINGSILKSNEFNIPPDPGTTLTIVYWAINLLNLSGAISIVIGIFGWFGLAKKPAGWAVGKVVEGGKGVRSLVGRKEERRLKALEEAADLMEKGEKQVAGYVERLKELLEDVNESDGEEINKLRKDGRIRKSLKFRGILLKLNRKKLPSEEKTLVNFLIRSDKTCKKCKTKEELKEVLEEIIEAGEGLIAVFEKEHEEVRKTTSTNP